MSEARDGLKFRVIVSNASGSVTSEVATLTVGSNDFVVNDVTYTKLSDTTCAVKSYAGTAQSLTIPATVEGFKVVEIGEGAFEGNTDLKSITLPSSIVAIRARAFKGCANLSEMKQLG